MYVGLFCRSTPLGSKPFRIQQFRRAPTRAVVTTITRHGTSSNGKHIGSDPGESNIRKKSATIVGNENVFLHLLLSVVVLKRVYESYPFQVTVGEIRVMEILKATCDVL